jgi:hypothetical protein
MKRIYSGLGQATTPTRRRDEMLRHTSAAASKLLRYSPAQLNAALAKLDIALPANVRKVAAYIHRTRGWPMDRATHEALTLALADALIARFQTLGQRMMEGDSVSLSGRLVGLGGLGSDPPERVIENLARGIACSRGLQTTTTDLTGREQGRTAADATNVGFEVARAFATCPEEGPSTPLPPAQAEVRGDDSMSIIVPVAIGVGVLAVLGGAIWYTTRRGRTS